MPTLAALVPGVTAGLLGEVIVADAGSRDATAEVADIAGCRFMTSSEPLGTRLKAAAAATRAPWLMFLRAGCVPEPGWVECRRTLHRNEPTGSTSTRAAVFRPPGVADLLRPGLAELFALVRVTLGGGAKPEQGLLIARRHYDALGGHPGRRRRRGRHAAPDRAAAASPCWRPARGSDADFPLMPAQADIHSSIQAFYLALGPRFRGDEREIDRDMHILDFVN